MQITLPLLSLKLVAIAKMGPTPLTGWFAGPYVDLFCALMAFLCVFCGWFSLAGYNVGIPGEDAGVYWGLFMLGLAAMGADLGIIYTVAIDSGGKLGSILSFSIPWIGYAVVYLAVAMDNMDTHVEDTLYAILDVFCKAVFGLATVYNILNP